MGGGPRRWVALRQWAGSLKTRGTQSRPRSLRKFTWEASAWCQGIHCHIGVGGEQVVPRAALPARHPADILHPGLLPRGGEGQEDAR